MITAAACRTLVSEPVRTVHPAAFTHQGRDTDWSLCGGACVAARDVPIRAGDEIIAFIWRNALLAEATRTIVVPVTAQGEHDGDELLTDRERFRLAQFRGLALVGRTRRPRPSVLARAASRVGLGKLVAGATVPLGGCVWYDVIDRERGTFLDNDEAFHPIARVGRMEWLPHVHRGSFASGVLAEAWIRATLIEGYPTVDEFLLRTTNETLDEDGRRRQYLIRRADWL